MGKLNIQCFTCAHSDVCKLSDAYKSAIRSLENADYRCSNNEKNEIAMIRNAEWLDVELKCKQYQGVRRETRTHDRRAVPATIR